MSSPSQLVWGLFKGGVTEGGGFHTPVRGTIFFFVRNGAVTPGPSREGDITSFVKGRPKSARQSRDSTVAARRVQSVTVPSSRVSRECRSPGLRSPPLKKCPIVTLGAKRIYTYVFWNSLGQDYTYTYTFRLCFGCHALSSHPCLPVSRALKSATQALTLLNYRQHQNHCTHKIILHGINWWNVIHYVYTKYISGE